MITRPNVLFQTGCTHQVPVGVHRPPRISLGPDTRSLVIDIDRSMGVGFATQKNLQFSLNVTKKGVDDFTLVSEAYANGKAHFNVVNSAQFSAKGLYFASVVINGCCVGQVEIVKAPSYSLQGATTAESTCADSVWVEPICDPAESCDATPEVECGCDPIFEPNCIPCTMSKIPMEDPIFSERQRVGCVPCDPCCVPPEITVPTIDPPDENPDSHRAAAAPPAQRKKAGALPTVAGYGT